MSAIDKMIAEWNSLGTPLEERLRETLSKLEQSYDDRLRLQWRVHCQRRSLRENWEIFERRAKYMGTPESRNAFMRVVGWLKATSKELKELRASQ